MLLFVFQGDASGSGVESGQGGRKAIRKHLP